MFRFFEKTSRVFFLSLSFLRKTEEKDRSEMTSGFNGRKKKEQRGGNNALVRFSEMQNLVNFESFNLNLLLL